MRNRITISFLFLAISAFAQEATEEKLTRFVDPFIGTLGEGNVYTGSCLPHSFVKRGSDAFIIVPVFTELSIYFIRTGSPIGSLDFQSLFFNLVNVRNKYLIT